MGTREEFDKLLHDPDLPSVASIRMMAMVYLAAKVGDESADEGIRVTCAIHLLQATQPQQSIVAEVGYTHKEEDDRDS